MIGNRFVFIDGTIVGTTPISLSESDVTMSRLSSQSGTTGASLIGYGGSANWPIPAGTVENALDSVDSILFAPTGSSKIGYAGSPNAWIPSGKVDAALNTVDTALASQTGITGAARVGYGGSVAWHSDSAAPTALPASTIEVAIDNVVTQLKAADPTVSGGRKVGTSAITGTGASPGNTNFSLTASSVWGQFNQLLANANGLNSRVIESGHRLTTAAPLRKEFGYAGMPLAGAVMLQAELQAPVNLRAATPAGVPEYGSLDLQPITYTGVGDDILPLNNDLTFYSAVKLELTGMTALQFAAVFEQMPVVRTSVNSSPYTVPLIFLKITGLSGCTAIDGIYTLVSYNLAAQTITVQALDGSTPDFTGMSGAASGTFLSAISSGNDRNFTRIHAHVRSDLTGAGVGAPWALFGAAGVGSKLLEVYTPDENTGALKTEIFANKAIFYGPNRTDILVTEARDTSNILNSTDKEKLDGNESGLPTDASSSHHHGSSYTELFLVSPRTTDAFTKASMPSTSPGLARTIAFDATFAPVAAVFSYALLLLATVTNSPTTLTLVFEEYAAPYNALFTLSFEMDDLASKIFYGQVVVPVDTVGRFRVKATVSVNVTSSAGIELYCNAMHRYPVTG
jgi:hypothetical protein